MKNNYKEKKEGTKVLEKYDSEFIAKVTNTQGYSWKVEAGSLSYLIEKFSKNSNSL